MFGQDLEQELLSVILKISDATTPESIVDLVDEIIELLNKHMQEQAENNADAGDESDPEDCDSKETQSDTTPGDNTQPGDSEDNTEQEASASDENGNGQEQSQSKSQKNSGSVKTAIKQALDSAYEIEDFGQQLMELAQRKERAASSPYYEIAQPVPVARLRAEGYLPKKIHASSSLVAELSSRLRGLLQAQDLYHASPGMSGNRIARNRLHRIKTGDPHLFLKKSPKKMVNTAVHLLIDNSTSMTDGRRFFKTRESALALIKAFEPIRGINIGASIFPAFYPYVKFGETHSIPVATVLNHNRHPGKTILYPGEPNGETPLGPALRYAASVMLATQEPRKVLLILTDGEPDCTDDARLAVDEAVNLGIEVLALGIEQLVYPDIFPHFEVVESAQDLPEKMFALLEQVLLEHN
jgi:nitric oxide reductase activation protein